VKPLRIYGFSLLVLRFAAGLPTKKRKNNVCFFTVYGPNMSCLGLISIAFNLRVKAVLHVSDRTPSHPSHYDSEVQYEANSRCSTAIAAMSVMIDTIRSHIQYSTTLIINCVSWLGFLFFCQMIVLSDDRIGID
jgi:hypothetical protein